MAKFPFSWYMADFLAVSLFLKKIAAMYYHFVLCSCAGQSFSVQEPLEALENGSLSIFCLTFPDGPVAAAIVLREDGVRPVSRVSDGATRVATYREFILSDIVREDNGREFTCSASEVITAPAQLTVFCKHVQYQRKSLSVLWASHSFFKGVGEKKNAWGDFSLCQ